MEMILEVGLYHLEKYFNICYKIITKEPLPRFKWYYNIIHMQIRVFLPLIPMKLGKECLGCGRGAEQDIRLWQMHTFRRDTSPNLK